GQLHTQRQRGYGRVLGVELFVRMPVARAEDLAANGAEVDRVDGVGAEEVDFRRAPGGIAASRVEPHADPEARLVAQALFLRCRDLTRPFDADVALSGECSGLVLEDVEALPRLPVPRPVLPHQRHRRRGWCRRPFALLRL